MKLSKRIASVALGASLVVGLAIIPTTSASASTTCTANVYGPGGYSVCVGYIQTMLNSWANDYGIKAIAVDNSYGNATTSRVKQFQGDMTNPKLATDGYVGPATWKALCGWTSVGTAAAKKARVAAGC
ncbi:peptidoglycan-binding domain-containing protein [Rathayibacter sp. CAU 1779]